MVNKCEWISFIHTAPFSQRLVKRCSCFVHCGRDYPHALPPLEAWSVQADFETCCSFQCFLSQLWLVPAMLLAHWNQGRFTLLGRIGLHFWVPFSGGSKKCQDHVGRWLELGTGPFPARKTIGAPKTGMPPPIWRSKWEVWLPGLS